MTVLERLSEQAYDSPVKSRWFDRREAFLAAGGLQLREDYHLSGKGEPCWPAYFHLDPFDRWWERLDAYRTVIVEQVTRGLNLLGAPLRTALETLRV